jgi:hypothetical protein
MPWYLQIVIAMGGASVGLRAYLKVYERQHPTSQSLDPVTDRSWRILSRAVGICLFSFVAGVTAAALRAPRWLGALFLGLLVASVVAGVLSAGVLWRRTKR